MTISITINFDRDEVDRRATMRQAQGGFCESVAPVELTADEAMEYVSRDVAEFVRDRFHAAVMRTEEVVPA